MLRQIVLDTETTGIGPEHGHKIIEIGCVELIDRRLTGNHFHTYLNPQRPVDEGAFRVHGISTEFLQDKPLFKDVVEVFWRYIDGAELIIHNAPFDVGFLNAELSNATWSSAIHEVCRIIDTLVLAREKHPGQRNNLDALCKRYDIDNSNRQLHGALLDAEILAHVYLAMTGGQAQLFLDADINTGNLQAPIMVNHTPLTSTSPVYLASEEELAKHLEFVAFLQKKSGLNYWEDK